MSIHLREVVPGETAVDAGAWKVVLASGQFFVVRPDTASDIKSWMQSPLPDHSDVVDVTQINGQDAQFRLSAVEALVQLPRLLPKPTPQVVVRGLNPLIQAIQEIAHALDFACDLKAHADGTREENLL